MCAKWSSPGGSVKQLPIRLAGDGQETPGGKMVHALRSMGSAAMNYTQVASGGLDLYWYVATSATVPPSVLIRFCREIGCWCVNSRVESTSSSLLSYGVGLGMSAYALCISSYFEYAHQQALPGRNRDCARSWGAHQRIIVNTGRCTLVY